jgi:hypothetical protein
MELDIIKKLKQNVVETLQEKTIIREQREIPKDESKFNYENGIKT